MRHFKTEGIVIKRKDSGEADRIITIFTKTNGKINVKAPGVRKITSKRSSHTELLNLSTLTLYRGSHSVMPVVTEAQTILGFEKIKKNLKKIGLAFYICELVDKLSAENQENREIFLLIKSTFEKLCHVSDDRIADEFEEKVLSLLGFMPSSFILGDRKEFIENILEKKIRSSEILPLFTD